MSYVLEIRIDGLPKTTGNANQHWKSRWLESKKWKKIVYAHIPFHLRPFEPLKKALVTLTRFAHGREPDSDNLRISFKHITDGLVEAGIIIDDNPNVIGMPIVVWKTAPPKKGYITIKVEEI